MVLILLSLFENSRPQHKGNPQHDIRFRALFIWQHPQSTHTHLFVLENDESPLSSDSTRCLSVASLPESRQCPTYDRRLVTIKRVPIPGVADQPSDYRTSAHACSRTLCLLASDVEMLTCTSCLSKTEWLRAGPWNTHALSQSPRQTSLIISNKPCFVGYSIQWRRSLRRLLPHFSSRSKYCQG